MIFWNAAHLRQFGIIDIEFDQSFGMLAYEGYGNDDQGNPIMAGAADFIVGIGSEPFEPPNPALITHNVVELRYR